MAQHAELRPSTMDVVLGTASRALREARSMRTRRSGSAHWDDGQGGGVVTGPRAGEYGGIGRITGDGMLEPLFDLDPIKQAVDQANGKSDQAIEQAEQVRTQAEAGVAEAKSDAAAATAKAEQVRKDTASAVQSVKDQAASADSKAQKASEKAEQVRKDTETMVRAVRDSVDAAESKAQKASEKADKLAGSITDVTATVNGHSTQLKELSTKVEGAVSANGETVKSVTELKQTVTGLSATVAQNSKTATDALSKATSVEATANGLKTQVTQNSKTASDALSKATSVEQTANGITATLSKDYQTAKAADAKYSTKTELTATSQSLAAKITEAAEKGDQALSKASSVEATASGLTATIGEQAKRLDSTVSTLNTVKATADSNSATIRQTSVSFLMDPCFATGADKVYNISVNADDPLGVDLPGTATSYGKSVGGYDDKASNVTVTTIPGHTYRMEFDWKPASDMPADVGEGIGAFVWKPDGSGYSDFNIAGVGSNRDVRWHHVVKDWTAPSDDSWPKVIPAIRTPPRARYLLTNWRFYDYTASREILSKATSVEQDLNGFKASVSQTYETKSDSDAKKTTLEQNLNGFETTVSNTYLSKSDAGKTYATQSSLSQTSSGLTSKITENARKADAAMSKASSVEQTAKGLSTQITETARKADTATVTANTAKSTADSNKATISQVSTTANDALSRTSSLEQNLSGFKSEVGQTYATKSDMGKQSSGSNLWCNQLFDPDKPQITGLVDNVTAPNGSRVNLLSSRDHFNAGTDFPVVPGHTYVMTAYAKPVKGNLSLRAGIWYTKQTGGNSFDSYVDAESTTPLNDGWMTATWRFTCPGGKSRGCVYFQIDQWNDNLSTQWLVANVTCTDVTGLQPAGDYATNSSLSQTADSIRASVTETARKADAAMSKASSVEQTASGLSTRISEVARKGDQTVQSLNALQTDVTGFKQTVQQTYATGARVSRLESGLDGFKSTVSQTYSPKSETADLAASTVRRYRLSMSGAAAWYKIGYWHPIGQGSVAAIHVYTGAGTNGDETQNSEFTVMLKKGWTGSSDNHRRDYGVNLIRQRNAADVQVKAFSYHPGGQDPETTPVDIWIYQPWPYGGGHYDVSYDGSWTHMTEVQTWSPVEDSTHTLQSSVGYETLSNTSYVDQTSRSVSLGVVEEYKNGQHGSALATQSDITAAKDSITSTVSKTYATQSGVDATYARKTELKQTENSLTLKVQSASDTADSAKTNASNAQSRVGVLETMVRADGNGVRVGKTTNGQYTGYSALVNASGSFDVLDRNNKVVARFSSSGVAIDTGSGIFSINGKEWSAVATGVVNGPYGVRINWIRFGKLVLVNGVASVTGPFSNVTNLSVYEKWPSAPAPADQGTILFNGNNQQNFQIRVGWNGHMELSGSGQPGYWYSYCGVWNVA